MVYCCTAVLHACKHMYATDIHMHILDCSHNCVPCCKGTYNGSSGGKVWHGGLIAFLSMPQC